MNDAKLAVLFVHGIQGQPKQFQFLTDALPSSVEGRAILLPGHGKTAREFHAVGRADWQAAVRKETEALLAQGKRVLYVGHSMGCLQGSRSPGSLARPTPECCCWAVPSGSVFWAASWATRFAPSGESGRRTRATELPARETAFRRRALGIFCASSIPTRS